MTRVLLTLLVGFVVSLGTSAAFAETFECKRYTDDAHGFTTYSDFESWFPKRINLSPYGWDAAGSGSKAVLKQKNRRKYHLLPNGKMIAGMKPKLGFKTVDNVRYNCDRTSLQLTAGLKRKSTDMQVASTFAGVSDSQICIRATNSGKWEVRDYYQRHVKEAKRRGLSCGVSGSTQIASSSNSNNSFSNQSDHAVCVSVTVNGDAQYEAQRRGLTCGATNGFEVAIGKHSLVDKRLSKIKDEDICEYASYLTGTAGEYVSNWSVVEYSQQYVREAKRRGLSCGVSEEAQTLPASNGMVNKSDEWICDIATTDSWPVGGTASLKYSTTSWNYAPWAKLALSEAKLRGLNCGVSETTEAASAHQPRKVKSWNLSDASDAEVCSEATVRLNGQIDWREDLVAFSDPKTSFALQEAKRRGLSCGVGETTQTASVGTTSSNKPPGGLVKCERYDTTNGDSVVGNGWIWKNFDYFYQQSLIVSVKDFKKISGRKSLTSKRQWHRSKWPHGGHVAKRNSGASHLMQQFTLLPSGKLVSNIPNPRVRFGKSMASYKCDKTSIEVAALLDKLEKQPVTEVVKQQTSTKVNDPFAGAKAFCSDLGFTSGTEKHGNCVLKIAGNSGSDVAPATNETETASNDNKPPTITIASASSNGPQGTVKGRVKDNTGIAEVRVDGQLVQTNASGNFTANTYVPEGGVSVSIQAVDLAGLSSSMSVRLDRSASTTTASISFERLNPLGRKVAKNKDALALIIGVDGYENTPARAIYADSDAKVFADYANEKLGIPTNRIKTLVNDGADESGMLLAVKDWLSRASKKDKSDVYVFFAGHGLASDDGKKMYLLPYDGSPRLLDKTAILRDELFADIASANPKSVTVFLDTCYSGTTRGTDMLIASRPIAIKALEQSIPDNFTVMTAAAGDQTAKPLEEAKHGMFSYFLMKGMEGEADKNQDNKITAGELHQYVQSNVVQQSSGSQTPELQGDAERVLVRFQ